MIKGLKEVYDEYIESDYLEKVKGEIAKKKLLTGKVDSGDTSIVFPLSEQSNLKLICSLRKNNWTFSITVPIIYFNALDKFKNSTSLVESNFPSSILDTLESHLRYARNSVVYSVNELSISFYTYIDEKDYLIGVSNNEITFILCICQSSFITNRETKSNVKFVNSDGDYIVFRVAHGTNASFLRLNCKDYSYESSIDSDFSK